MKLETTKRRFHSNYIKVESGCWEWTKYSDKDGYGKFRYSGETYAHRVSMILNTGDFNRDLCVLHHCDNPSCVNPNHLFLGNREDNNKDCTRKNRNVPPPNPHKNKTHCKNGHEFTEENIYKYPSGSRSCRICIKVWKARSLAKEVKSIPNSLKTHCKNGHEFTEENIYIVYGKFRQCKECKAFRKKKARLK